MTNTITLPEKLSAFIRWAIEDARSLDKRLYRPDATTWHSYTNDMCNVCFAGAWLAATYMQQGADDLQKKEIEKIVSEVNYYLAPGVHDSSTLGMILNDLRLKDFGNAVKMYYKRSDLNESEIKELTELGKCIKRKDFKGWFSFETFLKSMNKGADELEAIGY